MTTTHSSLSTWNSRPSWRRQTVDFSAERINCYHDTPQSETPKHIQGPMSTEIHFGKAKSQIPPPALSWIWCFILATPAVMLFGCWYIWVVGGRGTGQLWNPKELGKAQRSVHRPQFLVSALTVSVAPYSTVRRKPSWGHYSNLT